MRGTEIFLIMNSHKECLVGVPNIFLYIFFHPFCSSFGRKMRDAGSHQSVHQSERRHGPGGLRFQTAARRLGREDPERWNKMSRIVT